MFKAKYGSVSRFASLVAFGRICFISPSLAQSQRPSRVNTLPPDAQLDDLVAAQNWGALGTALSQATDGEPFMRKMAWLHSRIAAGGPSLLGLSAVMDTWKVGVK